MTHCEHDQVAAESPGPVGQLTVHVAADGPTCLAPVRARLRAWLQAAGVGPGDLTDILVAVGEATANVVEHAAAGADGQRDPVELTLTARAGQAAIEITVSDTGTWRPPPAEPGDRGYGFVFMRRLMDDVAVTTSTDGTTVTMRRSVPLRP